MDEKQVWLVLGIEPTKNEEEIKQAYRSKLVNVNPEDDPEGFKRLREAYEQACSLAAQEPAEQEKGPEGPLGEWLDKVKAVYEKLSTRIDPESWKELFRDDICMDLETGPEVRTELLKYCMDHFRLPSRIWMLMDEQFSLMGDMEELKESFPLDFLQFVENKCTQEEWFSYEYFEGPDDAEYDAYLSLFFEIRRDVEEGKFSSLDELFSQAESLGIYHPYLEVSRAEAKIKQEQPQEAVELLTPLEEKYPQDWWIAYVTGQAYWELERFGEANDCYKKVLETEKDHYTARFRCAEYLEKTGQYEEAKESFIAIMNDISDNQDVRARLKEVNEHLIPRFFEECGAEPDNFAVRFKLGWCLLQNERNEEGVELLAGVTPDAENEAEYHSLIGRFYYNLSEFDEARQHFEAWIKSIRSETPQDEEEEQALPGRFLKAYSLLAASDQKLGDSDPKYYDEALTAIDQALAYIEDNGALQQKADILLHMERYRESVDICDQILENDSRYLPALVTRQDAYFHLRCAQEVIDDFYKIKEIFPYIPKTYELPAEVFYIYRQYDDVQSILDQAKENETSSLKLDVIRGKTMRMKAAEDAEYVEARNYDRELVPKLRAESGMKEELNQILREIVLCSMALGEYKDALSQVEEAIQLEPSVDNLWLKADVLYRDKDYEKALLLYQQCQKHVSDNENIYEDLGNCYRDLGKDEKAKECFEKVLEINPEHRRANSRLADYYSDMYDVTEEEEYFAQALPYSSRQLELTPTAYYYVERGLLYMNAGHWDEAEADFRKAFELEPEDSYAYNNLGCVYKYCGRYEEALEMFLKALECMTPGESTVFYGNLADCYERMGRYEEAKEAYLNNIKLFPNKPGLRENLSDMYSSQGHFREAMQVIEEILGMENSNKAYYLCEMAYLYEYAGDYKTAIQYCKKALKEDDSYGKANRMIGQYLYYYKKNLRKAEKYYTTALSQSKMGSNEYSISCRALMQLYSNKKDYKNAKKYFDLEKSATVQEYGSIEHYLATKKRRNARLYILGQMYYYLGDMDKAAKLFGQIGCRDMCRSCSCRECWEYYMAQGILLEEAGEKKKALEFYRKAYDIDCRDMELRFRIAGCENS